MKASTLLLVPAAAMLLGSSCLAPVIGGAVVGSAYGAYNGKAETAVDYPKDHVFSQTLDYLASGAFITDEQADKGEKVAFTYSSSKEGVINATLPGNIELRVTLTALTKNSTRIKLLAFRFGVPVNGPAEEHLNGIVHHL